MKVRHKINGNEFFVTEESLSFYICQSSVCDHFAASKMHYEPVPTETWQDVTSGCDGGKSIEYAITHEGKQIGLPKNEYRLVKEQVFKSIRGGLGSVLFADQSQPVWAFRVERLVK